MGTCEGVSVRVEVVEMVVRSVGWWIVVVVVEVEVFVVVEGLGGHVGDEDEEEGGGRDFSGKEDAAWAVAVAVVGVREGDGVGNVRRAIWTEDEVTVRLLVGLTVIEAAEDAGSLLIVGAGASAELIGAEAAGADAAGAGAASFFKGAPAEVQTWSAKAMVAFCSSGPHEVLI